MGTGMSINAAARTSTRSDAGWSYRGPWRPTLETLEGRVVLSTAPALANMTVLSATEINSIPT